MQASFDPQGISSIPSFGTLSSCEQILADFLSNDDDIGICLEGQAQRFIDVEKGASSNDFLKRYHRAQPVTSFCSTLEDSKS
jgi:hypothetical protein